MVRATFLLVAGLGVALLVGCKEDGSGKTDSQPPLRKNSFLTSEVSEKSQILQVDISKVISTPGSTRSYIVLNIQERYPGPDSMKTVLHALDAFEKHFGVKIAPGGWHLLWRPFSGGPDTIYGVCVDHDRPIDLNSPFLIELDETGKMEKPTLINTTTK